MCCAVCGTKPPQLHENIRVRASKTRDSCYIWRVHTQLSPSKQSVAQALTIAKATLAAAGLHSPAADSEQLLGQILGMGRGQVQAQAALGAILTAAQAAQFAQLISRRATGEPLQHILGEANFYGLALAVGPGVFIPRPETEMLAECALAHQRLSGQKQPTVVDFCAGSGALGLAIATKIPGAQLVAVEKSAAALPFLVRNSASHHLQTQILHSDLVALAAGVGVRPLPGVTAQISDCADPATRANSLLRIRELAGSVQLLVSNPPYVPLGQVPADREVRDYDPAMALYGGADGLELVRWLIPLAAYLAAPGAFIGIEHTETQGTQIVQMLHAAGFTAAQTHPDLTGRERFTSAIRQDTSIHR